MVRLLEAVGQTQRVHKGLFLDWPRDLVPEGGCSDGQNVEPDIGVMRKVQGWGKYSGTAAPGTGPVMLLGEFVLSAGTRSVLACTTTRLSKYNLATNVFDDVTAGANLLTGAATNAITAAVLNDLFIVNNGVDAPRKYNGTTWGVLGGSPPKFLGIDVYEGHVIGWNVNPGTGPEYRAQWSDLNAPETWTGGESGSLDLRDHNLLGLMAGAKLGPLFLLYKEQNGGIYALRYTGNSALPMIQELLFANYGTFSVRGVAVYRDTHYVLGSDEQIYALSGGARPKPIGDPVRKRLFGRLNWDARRAAFVAVDYLKPLVIFAIPEGASTVANRAYLFNPRTGAWGEQEWPFMAAANIRDPETTTINDLSGTINALTGTVNELSSIGKDILLMGGEGASAYVYKRSGQSKDGTAMTSRVVGRPIGSGDGRVMRLRGIEVEESTGLGYLVVDAGTMESIGDSPIFTQLGYANRENRNRADANLSGRWVIGRFWTSAPEDNVTWVLSGYRYDAHSRGRR